MHTALHFGGLWGRRGVQHPDGSLELVPEDRILFGIKGRLYKPALGQPRSRQLPLT